MIHHETFHVGRDKRSRLVQNGILEYVSIRCLARMQRTDLGLMVE